VLELGQAPVCVKRKAVHRALGTEFKVCCLCVMRGVPMQQMMYMCYIEHIRLVCTATECIFLNQHEHVLHHGLCDSFLEVFFATVQLCALQSNKCYIVLLVQCLAMPPS
jgi:hypothetical protein